MNYIIENVSSEQLKSWLEIQVAGQITGYFEKAAARV